MLKKSSKTPHDRLLSLFDILEDWLDAPSINIQFQEQLDNRPNDGNLLEFLTQEATKAGVAMPGMLANQLYFMASAAIQDRTTNQNLTSLNHAKNAAKALILAQTKREFSINKSFAYSVAASFLGAFVVIGSLLMFDFNLAIFNPVNVATNQEIITTQTHRLDVPVKNVIYANPEDTVALIAQINQMRSGNCQLIEALQLPDSYKKVYFENIVLGQISTNLADQKLVIELLEKVRCNYTPMLMANSK